MPTSLTPKLLAVLFLVCAFTTSATADRQDNQRRWSCALLVDYGELLATRLDSEAPAGVLYARYYGSLSTTAFDEEWDGFDDFDAFFAALSGYRPERPARSFASDEWTTAFRQLPIGLVREAWARYRAGAPVICDAFPEDQWVELPQPARYNLQVPPVLPPSHPDWSPEAEQARQVVVQIAPPVFDDFGYRALVINAAGMNAMIFEYRNDEWVIIARHWWIAY
jgi:hypothetical protein